MAKVSMINRELKRIVLCTSANSDDEARELLREFNMPFYN